MVEENPNAASETANPVRDVKTIIDAVAQASAEGRLLLFVGTGLSRAVLNWRNKVRKQIPGWLDLLEDICKNHGIAPGEFFCVRKRKLNYDCPGIASEMAKTLSGGKRAVKESAAKQTIWLPRRKQSRTIGTILLGLNPSAIVTTNYDEVLEGLLGSHCNSISRRDEVRVPIREKIAVWHFHGRRDEPGNLVLTREDYLEFFRPGNYAQSKLAQLLHDHFTLFVGYSLSDINLLAALDWAQNVFRTTNGFSGFGMIGDADSFAYRLVKNDVPIRRVVIDYAEECNTPETGKSLSPDCEVIRTSDVIDTLAKINESGKQKRHDLGLPAPISHRPTPTRKYFGEDDVNALLSSPSGLEKTLDMLATEYHGNSRNRIRIVETLRESYRRARPKRCLRGQNVSSFPIDSTCFLIGLLLVFPVPQLPVSCRIRFLEELEQMLDERKTTRCCPLFSDEGKDASHPEVLRTNLDWLRQVSLYGGYNRCALFARRFLKRINSRNSSSNSSGCVK